ncbi:CLUMA_CG014559, isoform A [Clunio marinus]|uniref:CLUMA_CG014559, isoform A n=1 Tax=Clunio marinus TaxID=568069 RepID=A0A1J1ILP9_9DIPT|nr:CLUMA_CG014559, isoform A [Clunio marinus]
MMMWKCSLIYSFGLRKAIFKFGKRLIMQLNKPSSGNFKHKLVTFELTNWFSLKATQVDSRTVGYYFIYTLIILPDLPTFMLPSTAIRTLDWWQIIESDIKWMLHNFKDKGKAEIKL